ncbi:hypothetical protein LJC32_07045 [Oscillospiraceae bacterium OttesenSCG-928-F05]|nr:hypothetical protein [Oscillospiraceae bacterium OttesenSCG-928-F05]
MNIKEILFGKTAGVREKKKAPDSTEGLLPISDIRYGMVITDDGRFVKILEVLPVNFYLKSRQEQQNIIYSFASWLKIAPAGVQITVITQKVDIAGYVGRMRELYEHEQNARCRALIEDNIAEVEYLAASETVTRRFFLSFQCEPGMKVRGSTAQAIADRLNEEADTARRFLDLCGLEIIEPDYLDNALCRLLYELINKKTSRIHKLPDTIFTMTGQIHGVPDDSDEKA